MAPTAPSTRRITRITPPLGPADHREADIIKKTRFFDALDRDYGTGEGKISMRQLAKKHKILEIIGRR